MKLDALMEKACPDWKEFLASFPSLDQDALRDFFRRCANPELPPAFLVATWRNEIAKNNIEDTLRYMFRDQNVSTFRHWSTFKRTTKNDITLIEGLPSDGEACSKFRLELKASRSRVITFVRTMHGGPMPPHTFANFSVPEEVELDPNNFRYEQEGILEWANAHPLPKPGRVFRTIRKPDQEATLSSLNPHSRELLTLWCSMVDRNSIDSFVPVLVGPPDQLEQISVFLRRKFIKKRVKTCDRYEIAGKLKSRNPAIHLIDGMPTSLWQSRLGSKLKERGNFAVIFVHSFNHDDINHDPRSVCLNYKVADLRATETVT